ncbi:M23 family metallopeptidase [Lachnoclostridium phytofermentans]|uniref:Peptidase M23B n=1 Tax=Lachnoclostridium phytofermentans (strain ATCC 700394 / DSM 18823 / ISDg) TaxID=357809 RepID=A9KKD3_LACP7|nr:M23 family metallopeptidase [Lachnoclostridium phytofermentans]ABX44124.1 peptidase M23B [Lachnoclostridium phytofermentans ISDg]
MKKQKLSEMAKKKVVYATLLVGVFVVVAVALVTMTAKTGDQKDNNLVGLDDPENQIAGIDKNNASIMDDGTYAVDPGDDEKDPSEVATQPDEGRTQNTAENTVEGTTQKDNVAQITTTPSDTAKKETPVDTKPVMQNTAENLKFDKAQGLEIPLAGNVILPYSVDKMVFHATLKQYKTNPAILIQGSIGAPVKAAAKGIVTKIVDEPYTGVTVTMDIGSGYKLVYGQLEKNEHLKVGDVVEAGKEFAKLAKVSKFYSVEGENLYFQVLEGDSSLDPMTLFKEE